VPEEEKEEKKKSEKQIQHQVVSSVPIYFN